MLLIITWLWLWLLLVIAVRLTILCITLVLGITYSIATQCAEACTYCSSLQSVTALIADDATNSSAT